MTRPEIIEKIEKLMMEAASTSTPFFLERIQVQIKLLELYMDFIRNNTMEKLVDEMNSFNRSFNTKSFR